MTKRAVILHAALILASAAPALPQIPEIHRVQTDYTLTSWKTMDGLPSDYVATVAQDLHGFLWLGTRAGLIRFDGGHFDPWSTVSAVPALRNDVQSLRVTRDGSLWIGFGEPGGVSRIKDDHIRAYGAADGLRPGGTVRALVEDPDGTVWMGNSDGLYSFSDDRWRKWNPGHGLPEGAVWSAYVAKRGDLYVSVDMRVYARYRGQQDFEEIERHDESGRVREVVRGIAEDPFGRIVVSDPIVGFRTLGERLPPSPSNQLGRGARLLLDRTGILWVATWGQGLWRVQYVDQRREPVIEKARDFTDFPLEDAIISLMEDRTGNVWASSADGLKRLTPRKLTTVTNLGLVTSVEATHDGRVWVSTIDELMRVSGERSSTIEERVHFPDRNLRAIHVDSNGDLWAATDSTLFRSVDGSGPLNRVFSGTSVRNIRTVISDGQGGVWLYDEKRGLLRWSDAQLQEVGVPATLARTPISLMHRDKQDRLWLGFTDGRIAIVERGDFHVYGPSDGVDGGVYQSIYEDHEGNVWLGASYGLTRFSHGRFATLDRTHGWAFLAAIVDDDARSLWIATNTPGGIIRMRKDEFDKALVSPDKVTYSVFNTADGVAGLPLWSGNRRAVRGSDGRLWFVTARGLTIVDPRLFPESHESYPLRIEGLVADERTIQAEPLPRLRSRTAKVEIRYSVLNLTTPQKTRVRYRLEGVDADWTDAGMRRVAVYSNLPPRQYRFRVVATNADGIWDEPGATLDFAIAPVFYQTAWFALACMLALAATIVGAWRMRLHQLRRQFLLVIGERVRLSREIHDTLLQSLVGVALRLDAMAMDAGADIPPAREQIIRMRKQVEESIREARRSIGDLRSPRLERSDLAVALRETAEASASESHIELAMTVSGAANRSSPPVDEQLLRIGREAVMNAVRHADAHRVNIELRYDPGSVTLRVHDDGRGFQVDLAEVADGHYGLKSMQERAAAVGGHCSITSSVGRGTEVMAVVPIRGADRDGLAMEKALDPAV